MRRKIFTYAIIAIFSILALGCEKFLQTAKSNCMYWTPIKQLGNIHAKLMKQRLRQRPIH